MCARIGLITLGAMGDSYYEYLLKMWLLHDQTNEQFKRMYDTSSKALIERLVKTSPAGFQYVGVDRSGIGNTGNYMEHLV